MVLPLHRVRFSWGPATHIEIEWIKGGGAPIGTAWIPPPCMSVCERETNPDEYAMRGVPAICWREDTPVLFERFQLRENTSYFIDVTLPVSKAEALRRMQDEPAWPFPESLCAVFKPDPPKRWAGPDSSRIVISGRLQLRNHAGILDLSIDKNRPLRAEVVCCKIGYLAEFQTLLSDVAQFLAELLLHYGSPTTVPFSLGDAHRASLASTLVQMRYVMAHHNLPSAIAEVLRFVHTDITTHVALRDITEIEDLSEESLVEHLDCSMFEAGGPLAGVFHGHTPRRLPVTETVEVVDTPVNRYVKHFLEQCMLRARRLAMCFSEQGKAAVAREAESWVARLHQLLAHDTWRKVGVLRYLPSNSQVLMKRRGYRDVLRLEMVFRLDLTLPWMQRERLAEGLAGPIRPVSELYEYWCFFQLRKLLAEICGGDLLDQPSFLSFTDAGLAVHLSKGKRSGVSFVYRREQAKTIKVDLYYNRRFRRPRRNLSVWQGSYTADLQPDYSIGITVVDGKAVQKHWLHFDAKYRIEPTDLAIVHNDAAQEEVREADDDEVGFGQGDSRGHRREDLFKMHIYRDGILGTRGAYILFPGDETGARLDGSSRTLFVRHPAAFCGSAACESPSVGAFALCPNHRGAGQVAVLKSFLTRVLDAFGQTTEYQEETGLFP